MAFTSPTLSPAAPAETMQADTNKNVEWIRSRWFWVAYIILLVIVRLVLMIALTQTADDMKLGWTILNILHAAVRASARARSPRAASPEIADGVVAARTGLYPFPASRPRTHSSAQISFVALHWMRGSPIWEDQGEYIDMTVWEQIDNGVPWTITRKFLLIVPIALCVPLAPAPSQHPLRRPCSARPLPHPPALTPTGSS